jgi:hypothetical protein
LQTELFIAQQFAGHAPCPDGSLGGGIMYGQFSNLPNARTFPSFGFGNDFGSVRSNRHLAINLRS